MFVMNVHPVRKGRSTGYGENERKRFSGAGTTRHCRALIVAGLSLLCAAGGQPAQADVVTDWNAILQTTVASTNAIAQSHTGAIVQLAVFEAVNAIEGDYEPYLGTITAAPGASPEAAAVAAAHRTLVSLHPSSAAALNAARTTSLAAIPDGPAKEEGIAVGEAAAAAMLQARANDGAGQAATVPYTPGSDPGDWRPTPPANASAFSPGWGHVVPFGLESGAQFRLPPPPALRTGKYENDYNEVKLKGRIDAPLSVRPQHRIDVARFYAFTSPLHVWSTAARQISAAQGMTLSENARMFALICMAMGDAGIAAFDTKYHYNFWRPVTAIRAGSTDHNPRTEADPDWLPLIATPAYPAYASGHATLSGAAREVLDHLMGKRGHAIVLTNPNPQVSSIVLRYSTFDQICADIDDARIYGGIHFRFDQEAAALQGRKVGNYILTHCLRPRSRQKPRN
jgi:hypothetical protein